MIWLKYTVCFNFFLACNLSNKRTKCNMDWNSQWLPGDSQRTKILIGGRNCDIEYFLNYMHINIEFKRIFLCCGFKSLRYLSNT